MFVCLGYLQGQHCFLCHHMSISSTGMLWLTTFAPVLIKITCNDKIVQCVIILVMISSKEEVKDCIVVTVHEFPGANLDCVNVIFKDVCMYIPHD